MSRWVHVCLILGSLAIAGACSEPASQGLGGSGGRFQASGGSGGTPATGGSGGTPAAGGSGGTQEGGGGTVAPGGSGGGGGSELPTECAPVRDLSICGNQASIVRVLARLPRDAAAVKGNLKVELRHYRFGDGARGGYDHAPFGGPAPRFGVNLKPGQAADAWVDMCMGGAMWSEENCEFNLFAWIDLNNNEAVDRGEPAGRQVVSVSCHDPGPPCYVIDLSCTSGLSCISFDDPPQDSCLCAPIACDDSIASICR